VAETPDFTPAGNTLPQETPNQTFTGIVDETIPVTGPVTEDDGQRPRNVIAEWTVTIILLLFGTTTLVQAFVIPTGSMEDTLLIGCLLYTSRCV